MLEMSNLYYLKFNLPSIVTGQKKICGTLLSGQSTSQHLGC